MRENYQKYIVWQKSMDLVVLVYELVKKLPKCEAYALCDQMRRSVVSIPSNIAEGRERKTDKDKLHFLSIAMGSKSEIETQLLICERVGYLTSNDISQSMALCEEVGKMLYKLISDKIALLESVDNQHNLNTNSQMSNF